MFRFGHFSDIHFKYDNFDTDRARKKLLERVKKIAPLDALFITGDIFYQGKNGSEEEKTVTEFICKLAKASQCEMKNVFICAGNHDLKREKARADALRNAIFYYDPSGEDLTTEEYYETIYQHYCIPFQKICENITGVPADDKIHRFIPLPEVNLLVLNTAVFAGQTYPGEKKAKKELEDTNLFIIDEQFKKLQEEVEASIDEGKLTICMGHHGMECFEEEQKKRLVQYLEDIHCDLYLCGHIHQISTDKLKDTTATHQISCGGPFVDGYNTPSFILGEYDPLNGKLCLTLNKYENVWAIDNQAKAPWKGGCWIRTVDKPERDTTIEEPEGSLPISIAKDGEGKGEGISPSDDSELTGNRGADDGKDLGALLQAPDYPEWLTKNFFDALSEKHPDVSSYQLIHDIHLWFLPHEENSTLIRRMQEILEKDLRKDPSGKPIGFADDRTAKRDFLIYYCLGLYSKRQYQVYNGSVENVCLKELVERYGELFRSFILSYEVKGWYHRRQGEQASDKEEVKRYYRLAGECDRKMLAALPVEQNAGIYAAFASTVSRKLEYEYRHKCRDLWARPEDRLRAWKEAMSYIPQIIENYKKVFKKESGYGKHYFICGKLYLFAPDSRSIDLEARKKQIAKAKEQFYMALACEAGGHETWNSPKKDKVPDSNSRQATYKEYIKKCEEQELQLENRAASAVAFKICCDSDERQNNRLELEKPNEDFQLRNEEQGFFVLADGVTRPHGEYRDPTLKYLASRCARELCQAIQSSLLRSHSQDLDPIRRMKDALIAGNQCVGKFNQKKWKTKFPDPNDSYPPCCTLLLALLSGDTLYFYNCCDTVGLLIRNNVKMQFTTRYNWLAEQKKIEKATVYRELHNNRENEAGFAIVNGDTRFEQFLNIGQLKLASGDRVILSTDGLTEYLAASSGSELRKLSADEMMQESQAFDKAPIRKYADDKSCIIIDVS